MITTELCLEKLTDLESKGINVDEYVEQILSTGTVNFNTLSFIVKNGLSAAKNFYELLRVKHNKNNSPLYKNIVDFTSLEDKQLPIVLGSLLTQINIFATTIENEEERDTFFYEMRAVDICRALSKFYSTNNYSACSEILSLLKSDVLVLEGAAGQREVNIDNDNRSDNS